MEYGLQENVVIETTLVSSKLGIITDHDIDSSIQDYESSMRNPEELYNNKTMSFNGLLRYIYNRNIKSIIDTTHRTDYTLLDNIFINIYLPLCYKFNRVPSVNNYCVHLINYYIDNIYDIRTGSWRPTSNPTNVNAEIQSHLRKWDELCNTDLVDYIVHTNSIGGIFRAKTKGFKEEQSITVSLADTAPRMDTQQLQTAIESDVLPLPEMP